MVKESLAPSNIDIGQRIVEILRNSDFRMEAAFWMFDDGEWRLLIATPIVHEQGRIPAYDLFRSLVANVADTAAIGERVDLVSPSEGPITLFELAGHPVPLNRLIQEESIDGTWIEGAYIYFFDPHTFLTFED